MVMCEKNNRFISTYAVEKKLTCNLSLLTSQSDVYAMIDVIASYNADVKCKYVKIRYL